MRTSRVFYATLAALGITLLLALPQPQMSAFQGNDAGRVDNDDIGGVVTRTKGPEAGVWVIAETTDLPTKFSKTVVTDDRGRYLIPDLPLANYNIWVRGYGLVDSAKVRSPRGRTLDLKADDARAGWKGKGLWSTWATRTVYHNEGGTSNMSKVVKFQRRSDPRAR